MKGVGVEPVPGHPDLVTLPPERGAKALGTAVLERQNTDLPEGSANRLVTGIPPLLDTDVRSVGTEDFRIANSMCRLGYLTRQLETELFDAPVSHPLTKFLQDVFDKEVYGQ